MRAALVSIYDYPENEEDEIQQLNSITGLAKEALALPIPGAAKEGA